MQKVCNNCQLFFQTTNSYGECSRYAEEIVRVYVTDTCGFFSERLQGAAPNTERGKCSTDTTGKPNS